MKALNKTLSIIVMMSIIISTLSLTSIQVSAFNISADNSATLQGNYRDDSVIVVLSNEKSLEFKQYSKDDFINIGAKSVTDLSAQWGEKVQSAVLSRSTSAEERTAYTDIEVSDYKQILRIDLEETGKDKVLAAIKKISSMSGVEYAGPNYIYQLSPIESEVEYTATYSGDDWYIDRLQLNEAWNITTGSSSVTVGVIDSGIEATHSYFGNNVNVNLSRDFTSGSASLGGVNPTLDHGTGVAGIIGARVNSIGVAMNVNLVSLQVTSSIEVDTDNITAAVLYAQSKGIDILNMSLGSSDVYDAGLYYALSQYNGLIVCAAGNTMMSGLDIDNTPQYPASYSITLDNMIVVGAITESKVKYSSSNFGAITVDLFAPGDNILTCGLNNSTTTMSQTSIATPFVTGVAALMLSVNSDLSPREIRHMIIAGVNTDVGTDIKQGCCSHGELNALAAVEFARNHEVVCSIADSDEHLFYCEDCEYEYYESHDLYMYSADTEDYVVKCYDCNYTVECWESPEYGEYSNDEHWIGCPCGCYSFYEPHTPESFTDIDEPSHEVVCADCGDTYYEEHIYGSCYSTTSANYHYYECVDCGYEYAEAHSFSRIKTGNSSVHTVQCNSCVYSYTEAHTWSNTVGGYLCALCGEISDAIPDIMSLPDPELEAYLASLSVEEREEFIASLPEDQVARVTALLPSDDEHLTE